MQFATFMNKDLPQLVDMHGWFWEWRRASPAAVVLAISENSLEADLYFTILDKEQWCVQRC